MLKYLLHGVQKVPSDKKLNLTFLSEWFQAPVHHMVSIDKQLIIITITEYQQV